MKNIIQKIFENKNYTPNKAFEDILFYQKKNQEYFLISEYSKTEIHKFFKSEKTNSLVKFFGEQHEGDIEKNTSLIILLKLDSLTELEEAKLENQIYKIEEDEYFFRKYVIVYTDKAILYLSNSMNSDLTEEELSKKLETAGKFQKFQNNNFEDDEYFLITQLFIKFPFLKFKNQESDNFETISSKLEVALRGQKKIQSLILAQNIEDKASFEQLEKDLLSEEDIYIEFLNNFCPQENES